MILTTDYIKERHRYWRYRIFDEGIWDVVKFEPVEFEVRQRSKTYNALFHRKMIRRKPVDKIIIYRNFPDMSVKYVDSLIVHEMIHQYIIQNDLPDSNTHGSLFKTFMNNINKAFPEELNIEVCTANPSIKGPGDRTFPILSVKFPDRYLFCNIRPSRIGYFTSLAERMGWKYLWGESDDLYFDELNRCTKRLQGYTVKPDNMAAFVAKYRIRLSKNGNS
ncbi:MAG: SprT-like domain-containing protein [Muribaculaceae bacterium]|nr:SprT-like domain-containing protein [Muribaculaceae bacterium]